MGELTLEERGQKIVDACLAEKSASPYEVFRNAAHRDFVRMHGPEHHVLDGAAVLTAYRNAGGNVDLPAALNELMSRGLQMPGAMSDAGACAAPRHLWELHSQYWSQPARSRPTTPGAATWSTRPARSRHFRA